jgi:cation diffusion facilitator CzcD-associated flavoprotein CzcO
MTVEEYDAVIVGGGWSGVHTLWSLRQRGYRVRLVEAGSELGGVWHWNCYPGARVDSEAPVYEFSMEELWRDWTWMERFPGWNELQNYFRHMNKKLDLAKDCYFNTRVTSAAWDEDHARWDLKASNGKHLRGKLFILCVGFASKLYIPNVPNMDKFKGPSLHTAAWPQDQSLDCTDKRVAVIGTGASGVQIIQAIGPIVKHLTVFQRTPNLCLPMQQRALTVEEQTKNKTNYPEIFKMRPQTFGGFHYDFNPKNAFDDTPEARREFYEKQYKKGALCVSAYDRSVF